MAALARLFSPAALPLAALPLAALLLATGCSSSVGDASGEVGPAPDVTIAGARGPFRLAAQRGRPVVLQFAPGGDVEAWAALAEASADLEAVGAVVLGVSTDGAAPESPFAVGTDPGARAAAAFGYRGQPLAVVVDPSGRVRGRVSPRVADDLYTLAAPVLVEIESASGTPVSDAEAERLRRASTVVVDLRPASQRDAEGLLPYALVVAPAAFGPSALPADLAVPVVLVGPDAARLQPVVAGWGYADVEVLDDVTGMATEPGAPAAPPRTRAADAVRG